MTGWNIGHDTHWRCAVLGDAAVDWLEAYDLSGTGNLAWTRDSLGGSPWQSAAMLQRYLEGYRRRILAGSHSTYTDH
jgi:hypothetical protein